MSKLCNKRLLAASLLEWTLSSETIFIEAKENDELIKLAQKYEIVLPSPDLALFKTIYAEIDKVNRNGVILPKKAVEEGLPTIRAKQINWSHEGAHQICGHILDSKIENNKIIVYGVLFKSLFREEFDTVEKLFAEKKLFVSYEIWNRDEKGNTVIKNLNNGYKEINPIIFHGCGMLLLDDQTGEPIPPACPNAMVLQLASKKVIEETAILAEKIEEKEDNFVYAKLVKEEPICTNCKTCTCHGEGGKENIMAEEIKNETILPEVKPEETAQVVVEEPKVEATVVEPIIEPAVVETVTVVEPIIEEKPVEATIETPLEVKVEEIKIEEPKIEETAQVTPEHIQVVESAPIVEQKPIEQIQVAEQPVETKPEVVKEEIVEVKFTQAEVDAKLAEKEIEITNLKKELDSKNQEIAELKAPKVEIAKVEEEPELTVGNTETKTSQKYVEVRKKLNKKAYGHESKGN